jgi:hypothetical protein
MWSHYAASHSGLLLEFERECMGFDSDSFFGVKYDENRPQFNPWQDSEHHSSFVMMASTKSRKWKYESEYRAVGSLSQLTKLKSGNKTIHVLPIPAEAILSVTFGLRCRTELKSKVSAVLAQAHFSHVRLFQMHRHRRHYALLRKEVTRG